MTAPLELFSVDRLLDEDEREITPEEAINYIPTMKKPKKPKLANKRVPVKSSKKDKDTEAEAIPRMYIKLDDNNNQQLLMQLKSIIDQNSGNTEVVLVMGDESNRQVIKLPMRIEHNDQTVESLSGLVGKPNVKVR